MCWFFVNRYKILSSGTLLIQPAQPSDSSVFRCVYYELYSETDNVRCHLYFENLGLLQYSTVNKHLMSVVCRCTAENDYLSHRVSSRVRLNVAHRHEQDFVLPKFLDTPSFVENTTVILHEGKKLQLDCVVSGYPLPRLTWVLTHAIRKCDFSMAMIFF